MRFCLYAHSMDGLFAEDTKDNFFSQVVVTYEILSMRTLDGWHYKTDENIIGKCMLINSKSQN